MLSGAASATTTANSSGAYTFTGLASGSYTITPSNPGYIFTPVSQNVTVSTVNVTGVNFTDSTAAVAPTITTQPANQTVTAGQTATFSVVANGTAPLSYQWQKNGASISGATLASYTTPTTTATDNGSTFKVVVSNSVGNATSSPATLTVTPHTTPPTVSITSPISGTTVSGTITITASASDNVAVASVQLPVDGANVGAADTTSPYSFSLDTTKISNGSYNLTAVATDTSGNQTTSAAVVTCPLAPRRESYDTRIS